MRLANDVVSSITRVVLAVLADIQAYGTSCLLMQWEVFTGDSCFIR